MTHIEKILEELSKLTVVEVLELTKLIQDKWGIDVNASKANSNLDNNKSDSLASKSEQTAFDISLVASGEKKIETIKVVRSITGLGLKEAKNLVDNVPSILKQKVSKEEVESIKTKVESIGAKVEVK